MTLVGKNKEMNDTEYFESAPTWENLRCPKCGTSNQEPSGGCSCRSETSAWEGKRYPMGFHKNKYHHTCPVGDNDVQ